jgi:hypothetical protein
MQKISMTELLQSKIYKINSLNYENLKKRFFKEMEILVEIVKILK